MTTNNETAISDSPTPPRDHAVAGLLRLGRSVSYHPQRDNEPI
jgi:hypothetical protein